MCFEEYLKNEKGAVERYVRFRIESAFDADDVLQEVYLAASLGFETLRDKNLFKSWLIGIARNKCRDFYRQKAKRNEIPLESLAEIPDRSRFGRSESPVHETLARLSRAEQELLLLFYFEEISVSAIAERLSIPEGTVKSRLFTARNHFKEHYPFPPNKKGVISMKKMPKTIPEYQIKKSEKAPFAVVWEEMMGWFIVPKEGEACTWGMYDRPDGTLSEWDEMAVTGKAVVHGIRGVTISVKTHDPMDCNSEGGQKEVAREFVAELTDSHCRYLAESHIKDGVQYRYTFLDGDEFLNNWGFGENNCGNETHLSPKGDISRDGNIITHRIKPFLLDIVGRYEVTIGGKTYDTVCVMDIGTYVEDMVTEQYLDENGRTILWRRFNRNDWRMEHDKKTWSERLPESERLTVNGETFVHWYDCITDYIL